MPEGFLIWFYYMALSCLALITFAYLFRTMIGPTFFDRILGVNNISTLITVMIAILAVVQQEQYLVDVALIYSMLGFVTTVIVCKAYLRSHNKESGGYYRFMQMEMQIEQRLQNQLKQEEEQRQQKLKQEEEELLKKQEQEVLRQELEEKRKLQEEELLLKRQQIEQVELQKKQEREKEDLKRKQDKQEQELEKKQEKTKKKKKSVEKSSEDGTTQFDLQEKTGEDTHLSLLEDLDMKEDKDDT